MTMQGSMDPEAMTLVEASQIEDSRRPIIRLILIMGAILLMILPFVTTFNEFLTRIVESAGLNTILADWVVPIEARMIAVILGFVGIPAKVSTTSIYLDKGGFFMPVHISWNCVGWQSFILYAATIVTGIQGPFTKISKVEATVVGLLGTFLLNLLRIASVAAVAFFFGQLPAVIYHDYGGTVIILLWLFAFWWFSHGWLLEPLEELPEVGVQEPYLKDLYATSDGGSAWHGLWDKLRRERK
jgi:exosortase/archaeosortase family protein